MTIAVLPWRILKFIWKFSSEMACYVFSVLPSAFLETHCSLNTLVNISILSVPKDHMCQLADKWPDPGLSALVCPFGLSVIKACLVVSLSFGCDPSLQPVQCCQVGFWGLSSFAVRASSCVVLDLDLVFVLTLSWIAGLPNSFHVLKEMGQALRSLKWWAGESVPWTGMCAHGLTRVLLGWWVCSVGKGTCCQS